MDLKEPARRGSLTVCVKRPHPDDYPYQSLRRVYEGIFVSKDFTVMAFFMGRFWLLKIQGVTIGKFATLQDIMDFVEHWVFDDAH